MAKYCFPTEKIKQFIADVAFILCALFHLKVLPLFRGPNAPIPQYRDVDECVSCSFKTKTLKKKNPVESSLRENDGFEEANKSSEMELRSNSSSFNCGSHTLSDSDLGSLRAEKEWSTTPACKLFQERNRLEEGDVGCLCCFKSLKLSAGKISKAFKGVRVGLLNHHKKKKKIIPLYFCHL